MVTLDIKIIELPCQCISPLYFSILNLAFTASICGGFFLILEACEVSGFDPIDPDTFSRLEL